MNLYLLTQTENRGYDTYDACVVRAPDAKTAKRICPCPFHTFDKNGGLVYKSDLTPSLYSSWVHHIKFVQVEFLGTSEKTKPVGVVLESFNAG